ncbi:hypothetical protein [Kitasatospora griseola]|uniref:hypothetical protein n=1 Tax=Kitasatospora griseola TaxID=2064 RepID=UPI0019A86E8E|nr:hypothetical protein [Kitasatospora griseola]GGQ55071.1 hypothetical protein GCM10010195_08350 [Kitasatospora griseola]
MSARREKLDTGVRVHRLAEIRREQDLTQPDVSRLENGALDTAAPSTIRAYVEALGGRLRMVADFNDRTLTVS